MGKESSASPPPSPPPRFRKPSLKRPEAAAPSSRGHRISRVRGECADVSGRKKVKFTDSTSVHELRWGQDAASLLTQSALAPNFTEPKTSEYKSFRKLQEETACKLHSKLPNQSTNLVPSETRDTIEGLNNSITSLCHTIVLPIKKVTPISERAILSPAKVSQNQGPEYENGIFTKKRNSILNVAAETLSLKIDDFMSNRSDLMATLLERLSARQDSSTFYELPKSGQENSNAKERLLAYSTTDCRRSARAYFSETTTSKCLGNELLSHRCCQPDDLLTSSMDYVEDQGSPAWHSTKPDLLNKRKCKWILEDDRISQLPDGSKSASAIEWNTDFIFHSFANNKMDILLPESDYFSPDSLKSRFRFTDKSLLPSRNSTYLESSDVYNLDLHMHTLKEESPLRLLGWTENIEERPDLHVSYCSAVAKEMNNWPLALSTTIDFPDQREIYWFPDDQDTRNVLDSPSGCSNMLMLQDTSHHSSDSYLSTPTPALRLEWKASPVRTDSQSCLSVHSNLDFVGEIEGTSNCDSVIMSRDECRQMLDDHLLTSKPDFELASSVSTGSEWEYHNFQFCEKIKCILNGIYAEKSYSDTAGEARILELQDQSPICPDHSQTGPNFHTNTKRSIFSLLPDAVYDENRWGSRLGESNLLEF